MKLKEEFSEMVQNVPRLLEIRGEGFIYPIEHHTKSAQGSLANMLENWYRKAMNLSFEIEPKSRAAYEKRVDEIYKAIQRSIDNMAIY